MKTLLIFSILTVFSLSSHSQTVKRNSAGNFIDLKTEKAIHDSTTTFTYTNSAGKKEPIYKGKKGSYYIARTSKKGNYYRKYLKY